MGTHRANRLGHENGVYHTRHGLLAVIWLVCEVGVVFEGQASGKIWEFLNRRLLGPRRGGKLGFRPGKTVVLTLDSPFPRDRAKNPSSTQGVV